MSTVDADDSRSVACDSEGCGVEDRQWSGVLEDSFRSSFDSTCDADVEGGSRAREAGVAEGSSMGSSCFVSLMEMTIFCRSMGVMCFSQPRFLQLPEESFRLNSGRALGMRGVIVDDVESGSNSSSDDAESRLEESWGMARSPRAAAVVLLAAQARRVVEGEEEGAERDCCDCREDESGAQQKVSLFQTRKMRFSNRLPSSIACEVFEKSDH